MMTDNTTQIRATTGAQTATAPSRPARGAIATNAEVRAAADAVLRTGARPTVDNVRKHLGRGSPNRITPILADWYRDLGARVSRGASAFDRVPASAAQLLETLWRSLVTEAERQSATPDWAAERAQLDLRAQLLTQRETDLEDRLRAGDALTIALERRAADLDRQLARTLGELQICRTRLDAACTERDQLLRRLAAPRPRIARKGSKTAAKQIARRAPAEPANTKARRAGAQVAHLPARGTRGQQDEVPSRNSRRGNPPTPTRPANRSAGRRI